jgi:hypothetical protein
MITKIQAQQLIKIIANHLEYTDVQVTHIGEFDEKGWKHADSLLTIDSNVGRVVIWNDDINWYPKESMTAKVTTGVFKAYRFLRVLNIIKDKDEKPLDCKRS